MRHVAILITVGSILCSGCELKGPVDAAPAVRSGSSEEAASNGIMIGSGTRIQNDSTPSAEPSVSPNEQGSSGIMMGSGT